MMIGLSFSRLGRRNEVGPGARTSLVSLVIVTAILAATAITLSSFDYLVRHRELAGATWHAVVLPPGVDSGQTDISRSLALVRAVPGVEAATSGGWASSGLSYDGRLIINGQAVEGQIFGDEGPIRPAIRRGRAPTRQGEVALGSKVLDALRLQIGDRVTVAARPNGATIDGLVVGEVVLASPYFISFAPGTGSATVASTFTALGEPPISLLIMVRYAPGVDQLATFNSVEAALGTFEAFEAADRQGATGLDRIRTVPILLIVGLLALVAAAVAHVLLVSIHRNRRDLAVLRAIGLSNQQAWTSVAVHGSLIALITGAIGITIGVIVGRVTWNWIAAGLFVVARSSAPFVLLGGIALVLVALAIVAALLPAGRVLRSQPAEVLRTT